MVIDDDLSTLIKCHDALEQACAGHEAYLEEEAVDIKFCFLIGQPVLQRNARETIAVAMELQGLRGSEDLHIRQ